MIIKNDIKEEQKIKLLKLLFILILFTLLLHSCNTNNVEIPFGKYYQQGNNSSYVEIIDNSKLRFVNIDFTDYWYRLCDVVVDEYDNKICDDSTMKDAILTALKKPLSYTRIDSERVELFAYIEDGSILGLFLYFSPDDLSFEVENRKYILEYN